MTMSLSRPHALLFVLALTIFCSLVSATNPEGLKFLEEKAKEEGVVTQPSGLLYKVLREGNGGKSPSKNTSCKCHYRGTLIDGTEFDSSYKRGTPAEFQPSRVVKGWTEALQLMQEGAMWELYIPSELGYGKRGSRSGSVPPDSVMIFTLDLLEVGETY